MHQGNCVKGIPINDRLRFFYGDKPTAQIERGNQQGGHYPCGTCGSDARRFDDLAHCLSNKQRSFQCLKQVAIAGMCTLTVKYMYCTTEVHLNGLKAFSLPQQVNGASNQEMCTCKQQEELMCRKIYNSGPTKQDCKNRLTEELKGVQRVPSLLLHHPEQDIASLNLKNYTILQCEPLHYIKGHLQNIFYALPKANILEKAISKAM